MELSSDRPVKCPYCNQYFKRSTEKFIYDKGRYWHEDCHNIQIGEKKKYEKDKRELIAYIEKLLNKKVDARIHKQIKTFVEDYGYKYKGIQLTLEYFFELKGNLVSKAQGGIGIVPYVYEEAKQYYMMKDQVVENLDNIEGSPVTNKKVVIKDPTKQEKYKINRTIDITGL